VGVHCYSVVSANSKLYLCSGEETYDALQQVLEEMVATGSLKKSVDVPLSSPSEATEQLEVEWHLCSDHKLMSLVTGMSGSGLNSECFLCNWDRSEPFAAVSARTGDAVKRSQAWAEAYLRPLHDIINKVSALRT
jgi:hypothetical protein